MAEQTHNSFVRIPLGNGGFAQVDLADYGKVRGIRWNRRTSGPRSYAIADTANGKVLMHHLIRPLVDGKEVDHADGDGLNNRRGNLRLCTHGQNMRNRAKHVTKSSRLKGVYRDRDRWRARIVRDGIAYNLGNFESEEAAGRAYDAAAPKIHRSFAKTNADLKLY